MIKTKFELKKVLEQEKVLYVVGDFKKRVIRTCTSEVSYSTWKFVKYLRKAEYYANQKGKLNSIIYYFYRRKYNRLGRILNIEMYDNCFDSGLKIYHPSNIVVHNNCKIGKYCKLHGDNCIGNSGKEDGVPKIGDNVDIGVGAKIIGNIELANNIKIGANAVVTKTFNEEGITLVGIPARKLEK